MVPTLKIAPSILSADFARLGEEVAAVERAGADQIHVDVMDGHFVPNITMGPLVVEAVRRVSALPLDVHLMIEQPERHIEAFAKAGASALTVHSEATAQIERLLGQIRELGVRAGVAINPDTPLADISECVDSIDILLVMTVNPGFGGQAFIEGSIGKIERARKLLDRVESEADLSVDGGIGLNNARLATSAGANVLVAGSSVFKVDGGPAEAIKALRAAADGQA